MMLENECKRNCWIAAAVVGLLVLIFTAFIGETSFFGGLFLGIITTALLGLFLIWAICREGAEPFSNNVAPTGGTGVGAATGAVAASATGALSSQSASGEARASSQAARPEASAAPATFAAPVEVAEPEQVSEPKLGKVAQDKPARAKTEKAKTTRAKAGSATAKSDKPAKPKKAKSTKAKAAKASAKAGDDLKQIKGVGPKLEKTLHENGVTSFSQIAAWSEAEIDSFAEKIGTMGGRIRSDNWVAQAKTLAAGGATEFSQRVQDGDVY